MTKLHSIPRDAISVSPKRQRQSFDPEKVLELATSITENSLLHPVVVRKGEGKDEFILVAGERRLKALEYIWNFGEVVRCNNHEFPENEVPCTYLGDLDPIDAYEIELEENIRRLDLSWQEKAQATSQLYELRRLQAEKRGEEPPTVGDLAEEIRGSSGRAEENTRQELIVSRHLNDPDVAKAPSRSEAFKILKRKEANQRHADLGILVGRTFSSADHTLWKGDCLELLQKVPDETFDVILTDPPYGIDAQNFNDSGGKTPGGHFYDDSHTTFTRLMEGFLSESFRIARPQSHLYIFCDCDRFIELRIMVTISGWSVFRTPLIWYNPGGMRAPWPDKGPQRKWQMCLYAVKGGKPVRSLQGDVLTYRSDENLGHPAQKPVALFQDLLKRSCSPGDSVIDPFTGSGTIFPAAHELGIKATGIELDDAAYGLAVQRLKALK